MKRIFAILFLPIRLLFLLLRSFFLLLARGNHVYLSIPSKFNDSYKSFFLRKLQGEEDPPFFTEFLARLYMIQKDPRVQYLSIEIPKLSFGFAEVDSICRELEKIKKNNVTIQGFSDEGDLKSLYLLTVCDKRYSSETGEFHSILPSVESMFFGEVAKKWNVKVDVFQSGPYKSFGEMFTRKAFSKEAKSNLVDLIANLKESMISRIIDNTGLDEAKLQEPILNSGNLKELGFFHGLLEKENFKSNFLHSDPAEFTRELEIQSTDKDEKAKHTFIKKNKPQTKSLSEGSIHSRISVKNFQILGNHDPRIAILPLKGQIVSGKPEENEPKSGVIEGYSIRNTIQELKEDSKIKAVILEIDSPGGSASESEKIFQALKDLDKTKPVYAYMSNTCASGGYYLACAARKIFSGSIGIVGSIGTIMMRFNLEGLYSKFGVTKDRIGFYPHREIFSDSGKLSKESINFLKKEISRVENLFLKRVEEARNIGEETLSSMSGGKVFAPKSFFEAGLSDGMVSFLDVVEELKTLIKARRINLDYRAPRYNMKLAMRENIPFLSKMESLPVLEDLKIITQLAENSNNKIQHISLPAMQIRNF
ncbi:MAG: signal peptide peptidase SppA [Leptospira sp.]|nr:signal peptide peptidase SppA [Leptospira sp.]